MVILGFGGFRKTALTVSFDAGQFFQKYDPMIEDSYRKEIDIDGSPGVIEILDTAAGTKQFASISNLYIKDWQGVALYSSLCSLMASH